MATDTSLSSRAYFCRSLLSPLAKLNPFGRARREAAPSIYFEQAQSLAATAKTTVMVNLVNGAVVATVLVSGPLSILLGATWFVALLIAVLLRVRLVGRLPDHDDRDGVARWVGAFSRSAFMTGCVWGLTGLFLFLDLDATRKILIVMVLAGMAAGAAATNGVRTRAAVFFIAPALLPTLAYFVAGGTHVDIAMAFLVLVFFATLVKVARTIEASVTRSIISEQRSEYLFEDLSAIANYTYGWEAWLSEAGQLRWVNPSVERITGYAPDECYAMADYPLSLIHPDDRETVAEAIRQSEAEGETVTFRCRLIRKDGAERWLEVVRHPARNSKGEPFGFRVSVRDITEQIELTEQLKAHARTDPLTGLANRRHFTHVCEREISRSRRFNRPLTFALLDIDHFKPINDQFGHAAGDECLVTFAQLCADNLRATDVIARWGGEEFALVMPETDIHQANKICERLRMLTEEIRIITDAGQIEFTVSIGLAQLQAAETMEAVVERADAVLYEAKSQGRNRVLMEDTPDLVVV